MRVRQAVLEDLPRILDIYAGARAFMQSTGNASQWGSGYPKEDLLREDLAAGQLYVTEAGEPGETAGGAVCGVFAFLIGPDPTYEEIRGRWHCYSTYGTLHRVAAAEGARGVLRAALDFAREQIPYLRIDTHEDNRIMQRALEGYGFRRCGIIRVADGSPRIAYDRMAFPEIRGRLGFGFMRLPVKDGVLCGEAICQLVDAFLDAGFNYFDTARGYTEDLSESGIRRFVAERVPRESFLLCDKLTDEYFKEEKDILPLFRDQLRVCGVDYFDFYLLHALSVENIDLYRSTNAFRICSQLREEGKIRHLGMSYHDGPELLEEILAEHPEIELVQLQVNYYDYEDASVQAEACCRVCRKYGKPIFVMEPVRGGLLARLPEAAASKMDVMQVDLSNAGQAVRFTADVDGVQMVLSGMSELEQIEENAGILRDFVPMNEAERRALAEIAALLRNETGILCTGCGYCLRGCPQGIRIPALFGDLNAKQIFDNWNSEYYYRLHTLRGGKASDCIRCGACEKKCPQHLPVIRLLEQVAEVFEKEVPGTGEES